MSTILVTNLEQPGADNQEVDARLNRGSVREAPVGGLREEDVAKLCALENDGLKVFTLCLCRGPARQNEGLEERHHGVRQSRRLRQDGVVGRHQRCSVGSLGVEEEGGDGPPSREGGRCGCSVCS